MVRTDWLLGMLVPLTSVGGKLLEFGVLATIAWVNWLGFGVHVIVMAVELL